MRSQATRSGSTVSAVCAAYWRQRRPAVRSSAESWRALSTLTAALERCVEQCARLDVYRAPDAGAGLDAQIDAMTAQIDQELDRLTVERLQLDLSRKQARLAKQSTCVSDDDRRSGTWN